MKTIMIKQETPIPGTDYILEAGDRIRINEVDELSIFGEYPGDFKILFNVKKTNRGVSVFPVEVTYRGESSSHYARIENKQDPLGFILHKLFVDRVGDLEWFTDDNTYLQYVGFIEKFFIATGKTSMIVPKDFLLIRGDLSEINESDLDYIENKQFK